MSLPAPIKKILNLVLRVAYVNYALHKAETLWEYDVSGGDKMQKFDTLPKSKERNKKNSPRADVYFNLIFVKPRNYIVIAHSIYFRKKTKKLLSKNENNLVFFCCQNSPSLPPSSIEGTPQC